MNCLAFEKIVMDLARNETQEMDVATRQSGLEHAQSCLPCARRLKTEQTLSQGLRAVARGDQSLSAPAVVEAALLAAFRRREEAASSAAHVVVPALTNSPLKHFFAQIKWAFVPAAALTALALIAFAVSRVMQPPSAPQREITMASPSPATVDTPSAPEQVKAPLPQFEPEEPQRVALANPRSSRMPLSVKANSMRPMPVRRGDRVTVDVGPFQLDEPESFSTKDFLVFDYAQNLPPADSVQLMRVRMPRERLAPLGIPLPNNARNENFVNADFLVGSDGVPRAIRVANR